MQTFMWIALYVVTPFVSASLGAIVGTTLYIRWKYGDWWWRA